MTPTSTAPSGAPTSTQFDGYDFSNNLFSDLAPLLTLFGEQVTKQFLSLTLGWADHILLAMGPLGIITIVVSAIRVSGPKKLKATIGRARESPTTAEVELLSSTSNDVCELWDGNQIVRAIGQPEDMKEFIMFEDSNDPVQQISRAGQVLDLGTAVDCGDISADRLNTRPYWEAGQVMSLESHGAYLQMMRARQKETLRNLIEQAPNITLNVADATLSQLELWIWAGIGLALQIAALVVPGITVYRWKWQKDEEAIATYGYPCFLSGSLAIIIGILGCSYVIEKRTEEVTFRSSWPTPPIRKILRVQKACTVGDQHFQSYAIVNKTSEGTLRMSRLRNGHENLGSLLAAASTFITITGYIIQFVGLRALHWSTTVMQLGVTLAMTGCRAWVRRGLATQPTCVPLDKAQDMMRLTLHLLLDDYDKSPAKNSLDLSSLERNPLKPFRRREWEFFQAFYWQPGASQAINTGQHETNKVIKLHKEVCTLLKQSSTDCEWSNRLCMAVGSIMQHLTSTEDISMEPEGRVAKKQALSWTVNTHDWPGAKDPDLEKVGHLSAVVALRSADNMNEHEASPDAWKVDFHEIYSIMELWVVSVNQRINHQRICLLPGGVLSPWHNDNGICHYHHILGRVKGYQDGETAFLNWIDTSMPRKQITKRIELSNGWVNLSDNANKTSTDFLVCTRRYPVRQVCAVELLRLFLSDVFSEISEIKGNSESIPDTSITFESEATTAERRALSSESFYRNTAIRAICSCIVEASLVDTADEANDLVIPVLFQYNLLPSRTGGSPEALDTSKIGE